jgi:hypothetical protein
MFKFEYVWVPGEVEYAIEDTPMVVACAVFVMIKVAAAD